MPPALDIYVRCPRRDRETIERFLDTWVDRATSEDRGNEDLMLWPLGATRNPDTHDNWEWEPAQTLSHIVNRGLDKPARAFTVYLATIDPSLVGAMLTFTADDQVIFGLSIDDEDATEENLTTARSLMDRLATDFDADAGYIVCEEPPPLLAANFPPTDVRTLLAVWTRNEKARP